MLDCGDFFKLNYEDNKKNFVMIKKGGYVDIHIKSESFEGKNIQRLLSSLHFVISTYKKACRQIHITLDKFVPRDKLTYILVECIIYALTTVYNYEVILFLKGSRTTIQTKGYSTSLLREYRRKNLSTDDFKKSFTHVQEGAHFRRVITAEDSGGEKIGMIMGELKTFFKVFDIQKEYVEQIAVVVTELVDNCGDHTNADCLVDIDVTEPIYQLKNSNDNSYYYGINIVVLNFSDKLLGTDMADKIENRLFAENARYDAVYEAYHNHMKFFSPDYVEEDFFNIVSFQDKISGRKNETNSGGTGLTQLINSLEKNADNHSCYVLSGKRGIRFYPQYLEYNSDKWIGFNKSNDFLHDRPSKNVIVESDTYFPGTAYNFTLIMKKGENNGK